MPPLCLSFLLPAPLFGICGVQPLVVHSVHGVHSRSQIQFDFGRENALR